MSFKRARAVSAAFNQDLSCFVAASESKFTVYSVDPFAEVFHTNFTEGRVAFVEMLYRSNILAIALKPTEEGKNRLLIWDDNKHGCLKEYSFKTPVLGVRLSKDYILVAVEGLTYVYDLRSFSLLESLETSENKFGLLAMASAPPRPAFACLGSIPGQVRVMVGPSLSSSPSVPRKGMATTLIQAHSTALVAMALNPEATLLATSSNKGTLVRVYDAYSAQLLHELRRGADTCLIYSIAFRADSAYVACTSDKFHAHVFSLKGETPTDGDVFSSEGGKPAPSIAAASMSGISSVMSSVSTVLPSFFTAQRSFAQFRVTDCATRHVVGFCGDNASIAIVCDNGRFFRASYGGGGECAVLVSKVFTES